MNCPYCHHPSTRVLDSRDAGGFIRRRRACEECERRFTTHERLEQRLPQVVKKDGTRQPFDREKLRFGFALACRKRPVSTEDLELAAERVVQRVVAESDREVNTTRLGELVLEALLDLDRVAYLRFASVYQELATPEAFLEILNPLIGDRK